MISDINEIFNFIREQLATNAQFLSWKNLRKRPHPKRYEMKWFWVKNKLHEYKLIKNL